MRHPEENEPDAEGDVEPPERLSWLQVAVLGAALAFLGFAVAVFLGRDQAPGQGSVDVGFLQDMASHHEQALDLSLLQLADGAEVTVRNFASEALIFQSQELGMMDQMLDDWGHSRGDRPEEAMTWMEGMDPVPVEQMPGMATEEQLDELREAEGRASDALFLDLMAEHHRGGLHMAEQAVERADDADVRELARRVWRNQAIEINEYAMQAERLGLPADIPRVAVPDAP